MIPKDCLSYCSSNPYLFLSVSFVPLTGVRGEKQELLYSTFRTIATRDAAGSFREFSIAWKDNADVHRPKVFILVAFPLKPIVYFSFTISWLFF